MVETVVTLKPKDQWREGLDWDGLIAEMDAALRYPGMPNVWWMPIQTRIEMLSTGIRSQLGIRVYGDDLVQIERAAIEIEQAVSQIPGTRSAFADIEVDRRQVSRYGLSVRDINEVIMSAIGGMNVSQTIEGRERYPINVRYARDYRETPEELMRVLVVTPTGAQVPLGQLAELSFSTGPPMIRSKDGKLVGFVFVDLVAGTAIADYVAEAKRVVAAEVELPAGTRLEWAGQFLYLERAKERLLIVVPVTLLIVFLLLYFHTGSLIETAIVLLAVPFSVVGAIWLIWLLDYNLSVAVWVGLIALAGLDAETGLVMPLYLKLAHQKWSAEGRLQTRRNLRDAIVEGAAQRIRPKFMAVATTMIALIPVMGSTGAGADVMKRIAAPMVGGLATSFLLQLTIYPVVFAIWKGWKLNRSEAKSEP